MQNSESCFLSFSAWRSRHSAGIDLCRPPLQLPFPGLHRAIPGIYRQGQRPGAKRWNKWRANNPSQGASRSPILIWWGIRAPAGDSLPSAYKRAGLHLLREPTLQLRNLLEATALSPKPAGRQKEDGRRVPPQPVRCRLCRLPESGILCPVPTRQRGRSNHISRGLQGPFRVSE